MKVFYRRHLLSCVAWGGTFVFGIWAAAPVVGQDLPTGERIAEQMNAVDDGESLSRDMRIALKDKHNKSRVQETRTYRKYFGEEKRSVIFYTEPRNVEGTAFLTYDYAEADKDDDQWLYLPAMRKVRRISASNRGDYFLGTDFTYDDMKHEAKVTVEDYNWKTLGEETIDGSACYLVEAIPRDLEIAESLGYSKVHFWVDAESWMKRKAEFWDVSGNPLKTIQFLDLEEIDGIWTAMRLVAKNHKTGHSTELTFSNVNYNEGVDDDLFTERALKRGD